MYSQSAKCYLALVTVNPHSKCLLHLGPRMSNAPASMAHPSLHSTFYKASAQEPLAVPVCAWYTGPRKAPHQALTQWPLMPRRSKATQYSFLPEQLFHRLG